MVPGFFRPFLQWKSGKGGLINESLCAPCKSPKLPCVCSAPVIEYGNTNGYSKSSRWFVDGSCSALFHLSIERKYEMVIVNGRFLLHRLTGVERYAREMLEALDTMLEPGQVEMAVPPETENIPEYKNIRVVKIGKLHNRLWEHISFPLYVSRRKGVSLNLCNAAPLPSPGVVCIHDVKIKARPQDFSRRFLIWYKLLLFNACKRAKTILTVSEFSRKELCRYYHINPARVVVVPDAWQHYDRIEFDDSALEKYGLVKEQYFFSMSSLEPNKNFKWIAEAAKNHPDQTFAVAGASNKTIFAEGLGFECPANMKLLGYVSDEEAKTLMRDCKAFLFPSFYEGFGLPPLEALSAGAKHVVVSDTEVMHEIFGDAVSYVDPQKAELSLQGETGKLTNPLTLFSWRKSAEKMKRIIDQID